MARRIARAAGPTAPTRPTHTTNPRHHDGRPKMPEHRRLGAVLTSRLGRLAAQRRDDPWAIRMLPRIASVLAAGYTLFVFASAGTESLLTVCVVLALAAVGWLLRRRAQLLLALASTVVTAAVTGYLAATGDIARGTASGPLSGQAVFGYWALAGMVLLGAWMPREHSGRRGVTVVVADVFLIICSGVGTVFPAASIPLGFLCAVVILTVRGGAITAVRRRSKRPRNGTV
ncbi:hypothetical protein [Streptomyces sp. NPDC006879]|uniref:hypothetical protein n=1 Tax=Streptomyces sp. NPDC006879 TaxID=3364767 RepID=UPI003675DBB2